MRIDEGPGDGDGAAPIRAAERSESTGHLPILLIAGAALFLRLWRLGDWSYWVDEITTIQRAQGLESLGLLFWTPTHLLVRAAFELFGESEWSARVGPALIGAATIPALYVLFRRIAGQGAALAAVAMLAVSPWHLYWSQSSRGYAALLLFYGAGLVLLYEGLEKGRRRQVLGAGVLLVLATLERRFTALNLGLTLGALAALQGFQGVAGLRDRRRALAATIALLAAAILAYEVVASLTGCERMLEEFFKFLELGSGAGSREMLAEIVQLAGWPLLVLAALGTLCSGTLGTRDGRFALVAAWVPVITLLILTRHARVYDRFAFVALPFLYLLAGSFLDQSLRCRLTVPKLAGALAGLWFAVATAGQLRSYYGGHGSRADSRTPLEVIDAQRVAGDLLVFHGFTLARHYLGDDIEILSIDPETKLGDWLEQSLPLDRRVWLLLPRDLPDKFGLWLLRHGRRMEVPPHGTGQLWLVDPRGRD